MLKVIFMKDLKNYENNRKGIFTYFYIEKYKGDYVILKKLI